MYTLEISNKFKQDSKRYKHDKAAQQAVKTVLDLLVSDEPLPAKYKEHPLIGNYAGHLECHGKPYLLLVYRCDQARKTILLYRLGSHAELFG